MPEPLLYEYAVIRLVPRVEREEFMNVGIIFFCKKTGFLQCLYTIDEQRLNAFSTDINMQQLEQSLQAFCSIASGHPKAGPIAQSDVPSRFRWLTAVRSTILQTSKVHPGLCSNEAEKLRELYEKLVLD